MSPCVQSRATVPARRAFRWGVVALALTVTRPASARPSLRLLEDELQLPSTRPVLLLVATDDRGRPRSETPGRDQGTPDGSSNAGPQKQPGGPLDFDLLGAPREAPKVDEGALRLRRTMLTWHQGVGFGMFALQLATTVVGQLNYNDKFGDNTGKYVQSHAILAYSTLAAFVAAGTLALLAPAPLKRGEGFDRVSLHKLSMFTAAAGMLAQGVLGIVTHQREGYVNQQSLATVHLVIGYVTLAAVSTGIAALVL